MRIASKRDCTNFAKVSYFGVFSFGFQCILYRILYRFRAMA